MNDDNTNTIETRKRQPEKLPRVKNVIYHKAQDGADTDSLEIFFTQGLQIEPVTPGFDLVLDHDDRDAKSPCGIRTKLLTSK